jgi:hypothetical protein
VAPCCGAVVVFCSVPHFFVFFHESYVICICGYLYICDIQVEPYATMLKRILTKNKGRDYWLSPAYESVLRNEDEEKNEEGANTSKPIINNNNSTQRLNMMGLCEHHPTCKGIYVYEYLHPFSSMTREKTTLGVSGMKVGDNNETVQGRMNNNNNNNNNNDDDDKTHNKDHDTIVIDELTQNTIIADVAGGGSTQAWVRDSREGASVGFGGTAFHKSLQSGSKMKNYGLSSKEFKRRSEENSLWEQVTKIQVGKQSEDEDDSIIENDDDDEGEDDDDEEEGEDDDEEEEEEEEEEDVDEEDEDNQKHKREEAIKDKEGYKAPLQLNPAAETKLISLQHKRLKVSRHIDKLTLKLKTLQRDFKENLMSKGASGSNLNHVLIDVEKHKRELKLHKNKENEIRRELILLSRKGKKLEMIMRKLVSLGTATTTAATSSTNGSAGSSSRTSTSPVSGSSSSRYGRQADSTVKNSDDIFDFYSDSGSSSTSSSSNYGSDYDDDEDEDADALFRSPGTRDLRLEPFHSREESSTSESEAET